MSGIDRYAYRSPLGGIDPAHKLLLSALCGALCLCLNRAGVSVLTVAVCTGLCVCRGGVPPRALTKLLAAPALVIALGAVTVAVTRQDTGQALLGVRLFGSLWGVSAQSLGAAAGLFLRALGCVCCMYFTVLTTRMTDLLDALRRLHVPGLLLALGEMIYRFVFVFYESAHRIRTAQAARLGARRFFAFGELLGMVFVKAYQRADRIGTALDARGFDGALRVLPRTYQSGRRVCVWAVGLAAAQVLVFVMERSVLP